VVRDRIGRSEKRFQEATVATPFPYPAEVEQSMKVVFRSLREHDRRLYAAVEAAKLGHGGTDYIAALLDCDPKTIRRGQHDLDLLRCCPLNEVGPRQRVRAKGGAPSLS
jgi:hypothetical protein